MFFSKLFYPRTVETFAGKLELRLAELARTNKPGYYDNLFSILTEEYKKWVDYRVSGKSDEVRLINVGIPLNNRSREVLFFRLPVPVNTRLDSSTDRTDLAYCRGLNEQALKNDDRRRPTNTSYADTPLSASKMNYTSFFYAHVGFALLRRNGAVQRTVDQARLWDYLTPNFKKVK
ncbi:hypothetical protein [Vibrio phage VP4B]|uniref:Uncharacterized protein n=1 Tax=Vibrio phage VP4B TaxID=1262540 RepID=V9M0A7_9CAUD|nr:hypothetical protein FDJ61_gp147 [Vibrio phage VP4B]AGB07261.1 hypothetical protein [Vibrio phage VP4B]